MYYIIEGELSGATEKTFGAKAPDAQARRRHWCRQKLLHRSNALGLLQVPQGLVPLGELLREQEHLPIRDQW